MVSARALLKLWRRVAGAGTLLWAMGVGAQRPGDFRVLGPGGGGAMFHPSVSPVDPQTVLVACDMSGSYVTHDGGKSWRMFNLRGGVRGFAFDPVDAKVMYAVGIGIWKSEDGGTTWELLAPQPKEIRGVKDSSDHADVSIVLKDDRGGLAGFASPSALAVDPLNGQRMAAAMGSALWRSKDGGVHWSEDDELPGGASQLALVREANGGAPKVVIASPTGFWVAHGWQPLALSLPEGAVKLNDEGMDVVGDRVLLLAVVKGTLFRAWVDVRAKDPEVRWRALRPPGQGAQVWTAASGHDGKTLYASFGSMVLDGQVWIGIAKSEDLGEHWTVMWKDAGHGAPNLSDGWISAGLGSNWGDTPFGLTVAKKDHELLYATDLGRTIKSTDGGVHWVGVYSHAGPDGGAVSNGLDVLTSYGVFFDPFNAQRMFIAYTDIDLMRSENRGESWWTSTAGVPEEWHNTTYWMVFDPAVKGRVWAAKSWTHDLPRPRMWRMNDSNTFRGGVCVSVDGGVHWTQSNAGMPDAATTHLVMDPKSPVEARTLYATTMGHGVFKSVDGGQNWTAKNRGIAGPEPMAWRLALASDGTLYVVIARRSENGSFGDSRDGAVYRSRDGAETWERLALPAGVNGPNALTIDPREPARMYLATWARDTGAHGIGGGIYSSEDAGAHWKLIFDVNHHVYDVTFNPANPDELYATGFESSAWHSLDRGATWERIAGYDFKWGHRVTPDPAHPGMVFINTFGGGVWYGKVNGAAGVESIRTKEIAPVTLVH